MRSSPGSDRESPGAASSAERSSETDASKLSPEALRAQLEEARALLAAADDRYLRARADLANFRRRAEQDLVRRTSEQRYELLRRWLEVVDSIERALTLQAPHPQLAGGLRAVLKQMNGVLASLGVTRIGAVGERFDPELHEAVGVVPSAEHPDGTIADVVRSGYAVDSRVLRPARVTVARSPSDGD